LAQRYNLTVADMNSPLVAALAKAKSADPKLAPFIIPDRVHPGAGGHLLMAEALLKAWHAPAEVSSVEIDAAGKRVVRAENTAVTNLAVGGSVSWTEIDNALPFPLDWRDKVLALAVQSSNVIAALDQQPLRVSGLTAARYALKIDGEDVGTFPPEQLARGLNLAILPTPMAKQALAVHNLTLKHNQIHYARWREVQVPLADLSFLETPRALAALDKLEYEIIAKQRRTAQPLPHKYELIPQ
jgi:hypothetical protein